MVNPYNTAGSQAQLSQLSKSLRSSRPLTASSGRSQWASGPLRTAADTSVSVYTLRFQDGELERAFLDDFARQHYTALRLGYLAMVVGVAVVMGLNEVLDESSWIKVHPVGSRVTLGIQFVLLLGLAGVCNAPGARQHFLAHFSAYNATTATVVVVGVVAASAVSGEADRLHVVLTMFVATGLLPHILPFLESMCLMAGLLTGYLSILFVEATSAHLELGDKLTAMVVCVFGTSLFGFFGYYGETARRQAFLFRRRLERKNRLLQKQVRLLERMHQATTVDLDGPVQKITDALKALRSKHADDLEDHASLTMALNLLMSGRNLFDVDVAEQVRAGEGIDSEARSYLVNELGQTRRSRSSRGALRRSRVLHSSTAAMPLLLPSEEKQIGEVLAGAETWAFDVFKLARFSNSSPLFAFGMCAFERLGLIDRFGIERAVLQAFLTKMEAGYNKVPYHTSTHAADVLHGVYYLCRNEVARRYLSDVDVLSLAIAAVIHDYQHPGINNNFLIATGHELAVLYNDRSVLENHHVASAFAAMAAEPKINILGGLEDEERKTVRRLVIDNVLATDFSKHFELLNQLKAKLSGDGLSEESAEDVRLLSKVLLKMADISNVTKVPALSRQWADAVMAEFWAQGDKEREAGLPVSTFFDRGEPLVAKCQSSFIDFLVRPLAAPVFELLEEPEPLQQLDDNRAAWGKELPST